LIALALGRLLIAPNAAAQSPINTSPATAIYLDNQWHYIPASTTLWFLFDYSGDRSIVELILVDGNAKKLQFNLYTPGQMSGREDGSKPIGRGSPPMVNCESGRCPSNHILWKSNFNAGGTYAVEVINDNPIGMPYFLGIVGGGVTLRVPQPQPAIPLLPYVAPTPNATPTITLTATITPTIDASTPTPTPTMTVTATATMTPTVTAITPPSDAVFMLGAQAQNVPEYSTRWFSFFYPGGRARAEIVIPGGAQARLVFLLFMQEAPNAEAKFFGEASLQPNQCAPGNCPRDLTWAGELNATGMYYVQVINDNPMPQSVEVLVKGTSIK
jgi:hypothetical protein